MPAAIASPRLPAVNPGVPFRLDSWALKLPSTTTTVSHASSQGPADLIWSSDTGPIWPYSKPASARGLRFVYFQSSFPRRAVGIPSSEKFAQACRRVAISQPGVPESLSDSNAAAYFSTDVGGAASVIFMRSLQRMCTACSRLFRRREPVRGHRSLRFCPRPGCGRRRA